jgi:hypothetical protein
MRLAILLNYYVIVTVIFNYTATTTTAIHCIVPFDINKCHVSHSRLNEVNHF